MRYTVTFIITFIMVSLGFLSFRDYVIKGSDEYTESIQENYSNINEINELHPETIDKLIEHYDYKEYKDYNYIYEDNTKLKVNFIFISRFGTQFEKTFEIVYSDKEPSLEEVEKELKTFMDVIEYRKEHEDHLGRDLENKDPEIYRQFTMSLLLTAFILSIPFSLLVITVTTDDI